jgi:V8-like Glu-specific endopeptidase
MVEVYMNEDLCLRCISMALTVIFFADSPGSTAYEAENTSTNLGNLNGRHPISSFVAVGSIALV